MKHFDLFSGYGGFSLALQKVYGTNRNINVSEKRGGEETSQGDEQEVGKGLHAISGEATLYSNNGNNEHPHGSINEGQFDGVQTIGFSEIDKYASAVLKYHWPNIKNYGDITKIDWSEVPDFDLLTGGSPCQDLSIAGNRAGLSGRRSGLFFEFMRAVREKQPKYFIWENVKGALSSQSGWDFTTVINEMAEAGYSLWWQVLNAKDFGVPQNRERIFVVGFRDGSPREIFFESRTNGKNLSEITQGVSDAQRIYNTDGLVKSQKALGGGQGAKTGLYAITRGRSTEDWKVGMVPPSRRLGDKDDIKVVIPVLTPDRLEKRQNGRRFKEDGEPSFTLTSQDKHGVYLPPRIRRLTPTECERLMGLPDGWTKYGLMPCPKDCPHPQTLNCGHKTEISDSQRYKLCGNGVVVNVVEEIIKQLIL